MIQFHALFARKHGAVNGYPVIASFSDSLAILRKYEEIVDASAGAQFRAEHAEIQLIQNLDIVSQHEFPDPAQLERERKTQALAEARRAKGESDLAANALAEARRRADEAFKALKTLTPEQKQLLSAAEAEAKAKADAAAAAQAAAEAAAKKETARVAAAEKAAADAAAASAQAGTSDLLGAVTEPEAPEAPTSADAAAPGGSDAPLAPPDAASLFGGDEATGASPQE